VVVVRQQSHVEVPAGEQRLVT